MNRQAQSKPRLHTILFFALMLGVILYLAVRTANLEQELASLNAELVAKNARPAALPDTASSSNEKSQLGMLGISAEESPIESKNDILPDDSQRRADAAFVQNQLDEWAPVYRQMVRSSKLAMEKGLHVSALKKAQSEYGALLRNLLLPPDMTGRALESIAQVLAESRTLRGQFTESTTIGERRRVDDNERLRIEREIAALLTSGELETWREYDATREFRQKQASYEISLIRANWDLSRENRYLLSSILAEEHINATVAFSDRPPNYETEREIYELAADASWERMYPELSAQQVPNLEETLTYYLDYFAPTDPAERIAPFRH